MMKKGMLLEVLSIFAMVQKEEVVRDTDQAWGKHS